MKNNDTLIESNKNAWATLAKTHYNTYYKLIKTGNLTLNPLVEKELGDIKGKKVLHLQCNTGADTIYLAQKGAIITGVDIVEENIHYAKKLAKLANVEARFIASDILTLLDIHQETYDIIMTTDGVLGWIPDLNEWGKIVKTLLKPEGFVYIHDSHPFMMIFDEKALDNGTLIPKYPYFDLTPDKDDFIGGYASNAKPAENYYWGHAIETILNGLINNDLYLTYFKEHPRCVPGMGGCKKDDQHLSYYPQLDGKLPLVFSLKAKKHT